MAAAPAAPPAGEQYGLRAGLFTSTFGAMGAFNNFRPVRLSQRQWLPIARASPAQARPLSAALATDTAGGMLAQVFLASILPPAQVGALTGAMQMVGTFVNPAVCAPTTPHPASPTGFPSRLTRRLPGPPAFLCRCPVPCRLTCSIGSVQREASESRGLPQTGPLSQPLC